MRVRSFFRRSCNIEDAAVVHNVMEESKVVGCDTPAALKVFAESIGRRRLDEISAGAERDGVFGVPYLIVGHDEEPFFGNDRIDWLRRKLTLMGLHRSTAVAQSVAAVFPDVAAKLAADGQLRSAL
jgi:2-hydroxychromene-2-carboxylate isomerase